MNILKLDKMTGYAEIIPHSADDLWAIKKFLKPGDIVSSATTRSVKPEGAKKAEKKKLFLEIEVEKAEFSESAGELRVSGIILSGKPVELVEPKSHHTIEVAPGRKFSVRKEKMRGFEIGFLKEAEKQGKKPLLSVVLLDEREAEVAVFSGSGFRPKAKVESGCQGKQYKQDRRDTYFQEILEKLSAIGLGEVLVAGPGFAKQGLSAFLRENSKMKVFSEETNHTGNTGFSEIAKKGIPIKAIKESIALQEQEMISLLAETLAKKPSFVAYGFSECKKALGFGAVKELFVSEERLLEERQGVEEAIAMAEGTGAGFHIFSSKEAGRTIELYSGYVALLRYAVQ